MVNVLGRSKGCKTCRTRKIKCSLERPRCSQCTKSNLKCLGYQRETIFVHSSVVAVEAGKTRSQPMKRSALVSKILPPELSSQVNMRSQLHIESPNGSNSSMSLVSASMRQQMLSSYLSSSAPSSARTWMTFIPSIPSPSIALEAAACAVSLAKLSVALDDEDMRQESLKLYTQGLYHVQRALWNRTSTDFDQTLGACMMLALYEVFECPGKSITAYHSHFYGCAKLIQLRGPSMFAEGFAHAIFQGFRLMGALEGLRTKSTFLSDPSWKTMPFSKLSKKVPAQRVLDVLLEGSTILRRADYLDTMPREKRIAFAVDLLQDCLLLDAEMQDFLLDFETSEGGLLYWPAPSNRRFNVSKVLTQSVRNLEFFPESYEFPNIRIATTMMLSWATLMNLWSGICHIYELLNQETTLTPTLNGKLIGHFVAPDNRKFEVPIPTRFKGFPTMARNVCRAVAFCLEDEWGIPATMAPLNMVIDAWSAWPGFEREIAWIKTVLDLISMKGMKMAKYIRETEA